MRKRKKQKIVRRVIKCLVLLLCLYVIYAYKGTIESYINIPVFNENFVSYGLDTIPEYNGKEYVVLNENKPNFKEEDSKLESFEKYSDLDSLGRCGVAFANISLDTMPTEKRGSIGMIKPSGWHTVKYDSVDGKYLYNRCHLIGYQLTGENANEKNLITCTRQMNTGKMLEYENQVANYVKKTKNHVLYRVTPIFKGNNLLASGVEMEAFSIEDKGKGISFHVYLYNVQDNITIDYSNGESRQN